MHIFIGIAMLPVERLEGDAVPEQYRKLIGNPFVGKLLSLDGRYVATGERVRLNSIKGMSGGPVFGLRVREDRFEIRLVAVQSSWLESEWIIGASRIAYLTEGIKRLAQQREKEKDSDYGA